MKTPEEYIKQYTRYEGVFGMTTHPTERTDMKSMIEQAQKDAYNQALEDAAKNAKIMHDTIYPDGNWLNPHHIIIVDKESILKLKK